MSWWRLILVFMVLLSGVAEGQVPVGLPPQGLPPLGPPPKGLPPQGPPPQGLPPHGAPVPGQPGGLGSPGPVGTGQGGQASPQEIEAAIRQFLVANQKAGFTSKKDPAGRTVVLDRSGKIVPLGILLAPHGSSSIPSNLPIAPTSPGQSLPNGPRPGGSNPGQAAPGAQPGGPSDPSVTSGNQIEQAIKEFLAKNQQAGYTSKQDSQGRTTVYDPQGRVVPLSVIMGAAPGIVASSTTTDLAEETAVEVMIPLGSKKAFLMPGLPTGKNATELERDPSFGQSRNLIVTTGKVKVALTSEPVWIIAGELPQKPFLTGEKLPFGLAGHPREAKLAAKSFKLAQELGISWARSTIYLFYVRYVTEKSDFMQEVDSVVLSHQKSGINLVFNLAVSPPTSLMGVSNNLPFKPEDYLENGSYLPKDREGFASFVMAMVERYDGDGVDDCPGLTNPVKNWQIENEPCGGPHASHKGLGELMQLSCAAIKKADPEAVVFMPGFGQTPVDSSLDSVELKPVLENYANHFLEAVKESKKSFDVFDIHYFHRKGWWKYLEAALKKVRSDLAKAGVAETVPIWMTELGTFSGKPKLNPQIPDLYYPEQGERTQAAELLKSYVVAFGSGVKKIFWAWGILEGFQNDGCFFDYTGFVYDGKQNGDLGEGKRKVAFYSFKRMSSLLKYWNGTPPEKLVTPTGVIAYRFPVGTNTNENAVIAAWMDQNTAGVSSERPTTGSIPSPSGDPRPGSVDPTDSGADSPQTSGLSEPPAEGEIMGNPDRGVGLGFSRIIRISGIVGNMGVILDLTIGRHILEVVLEALSKPNRRFLGRPGNGKPQPSFQGSPLPQRLLPQDSRDLQIRGLRATDSVPLE